MMPRFSIPPRTTIEDKRFPRFGLAAAETPAWTFWYSTARCSGVLQKTVIFNRVGNTDFLWLELRWAAQTEQVEHLDDLLLRRTRVGNLVKDGAAEHMEHVQKIMTEDGGWTGSHWQKELERYSQLWKKSLQSGEPCMMDRDDRNPETDLILAIDNGTQSVRALLFDLQGNVVCKSKVELNPYFSPEPGWAEQDPEYYWTSLCEACQSLWEKSGVDRSRIKGVTLTTQRGTNICVDKNGQALRPAVVWLDQRRADTHDPIGGLWGPLARLTGLKKLIDYFRSKSISRWISQNEPDTWSKTHKFLLLSGWHTYKLTGVFKDSIGGTVGYLPFNYRKLKWAPGWDWSWRATGLSKGQLAELIKPGETLGMITAECCSGNRYSSRVTSDCCRSR